MVPPAASPGHHYGVNGGDFNNGIGQRRLAAQIRASNQLAPSFAAAGRRHGRPRVRRAEIYLAHFVGSINRSGSALLQQVRANLRIIGKIPGELMPSGGPANSPPSCRVIALESWNP